MELTKRACVNSVLPLEKLSPSFLRWPVKFIGFSSTLPHKAVSMKPRTPPGVLRMILAALTHAVVHAHPHIVCQCSAHTGLSVTGVCPCKVRSQRSCTLSVRLSRRQTARDRFPSLDYRDRRELNLRVSLPHVTLLTWLRMLRPV